MKFNCFHHEIALGEYVKPDALCKLIRLAAQNSYNYYLPYVEHFIHLDTFAKAVPECAYTKDDWRKFEQVGREVGIEVIPMFNVAGHTTAICRAYPELCGAKPGNEFDITLDVTKQMIAGAIEEFCSISSSEYFLIGADEWRAPEHLLKDISFDYAYEYAQNINRAVKLLAQYGKRAIMWHDMIVHYPKILDYLTRDVIISYWNYEKCDAFPAIRFFKEKGFPVIMATGIRFGLLNLRRAEAISFAHDEAKKYNADGFMTTSWGGTLYEAQTFAIPISGRIMRHEKVPGKLLEATSEWEYAKMLQGADAETRKNLFYGALQDPTWNEFPEYRDFLIASLEEDKKRMLEIFLHHHYPSGRFYDGYVSQEEKPPHYRLTPEPSEKRKGTDFGIVVEKHKFGDKLTVHNGEETFSIYPSLSGSLQDYQCRGHVVIPKFADRFLDEKQLFPGGYDGYSSVYGFRPVYAFIDNHNPSIIWSGAFEYSFTADEKNIEIVLSRIIQHANVEYTIRVHRGQRGFSFDAEAENTAFPAPVCWSWNLPLVFTDKGAGATILVSDTGESVSPATMHGNSMIICGCKKYFTICNGAVKLKIGINPEKLQEFRTDWSEISNFFTPDYKSKNRMLCKGEKLTDMWTFEAEITRKEVR